MKSVFVSYHSQDHDSVAVIVSRLKEKGVSYWFDDDHFVPGSSVLAIGNAIERCTSVAVFLGPEGRGPFQQKEIAAALANADRDARPVIPVALPGVDPKDVDLPFLLQGQGFVTFKSLDDDKALGRLIWAVTGQRPEEVRREPSREIPLAPPAGGGGALADAVSDFAAGLPLANVAIFVGSAECEESVSENSRIARQLLLRLGHADPSFLAPVDFAGTCYSTRKSDDDLAAAMADFARDMSVLPSGLSMTVASLLSTVRSARDRRQTRRQLVVTTNLDTRLERSLLRRRISFARVVQCREAPKVVVARYHVLAPSPEEPLVVRCPDGRERTIGPEDERGLVECVSGAGGEVASASVVADEMGDVILYKMRGSEDVACQWTLSTPHFFDFARKAESGYVPNDILQLIGNSHALVCGFCALDPDLRLLHHALLQKQFSQHSTRPRYALMPADHVHDAGFRKVEALLGSRLKQVSERELQIKILDASTAEFLAELERQLAPAETPS